MVLIRKARMEDCCSIAKLIKELAEYEKMPDGPKINEDEIVGYALYFFIYSTWEGRAIYMEDLYVTPLFRHQGIGLSLWKSVAMEGLKAGCSRLDFCVLNWNKPSIQFYQSKGAINLSEKEGWNLFRLRKDSLQKLAEE